MLLPKPYGGLTNATRGTAFKGRSHMKPPALSEKRNWCLHLLKHQGTRKLENGIEPSGCGPLEYRVFPEVCCEATGKVIPQKREKISTKSYCC